MADQHRVGRGDLPAEVRGLTVGPAGAGARARRLRAPLLLALWALLAFEAAGGLVIFVARLGTGATPGETLHVVAGIALTAVYAVYQARHWSRVAPFRARVDYALGLIAALAMATTNLTGLALGVCWWRDRLVGTLADVDYPPLLSAAHNILSMLVLTFAGGHLAAVLLRERRRDAGPDRGGPPGWPAAD